MKTAQITELARTLYIFMQCPKNREIFRRLTLDTSNNTEDLAHWLFQRSGAKDSMKYSEQTKNRILAWLTVYYASAD